MKSMGWERALRYIAAPFWLYGNPAVELTLCVINTMGNFDEKFDLLKRETDEYFRGDFESEEAETQENIRIKSGLLSLIKEARESGSDQFAAQARKDVIKYLCEVCGHSGDLEILQNHTPGILSPEELEYIIQNSALSRWF